MPFYTDQLSRTVEIPSPPKRIISLVPSQTELLYDLGLEKEVVGITKFCVHPQKWFREKQRVGGTKNINIKKITALQPDLIIANKEENVQEQIEHLSKEFTVWVSDVNNLDDAYEMMASIGEITGRGASAEQLINQIKTAFSQLQIPDLSAVTSVKVGSKPQTAYLIWKDPYMTVGGDTFIHHLMEKAGFQNVFADKQRYPVVTIADLLIANCQLLFLSSEPYPFKQMHIAELQQHLPHAKVVLVDGEMFSWYGSRMLQAPAYFRALHEQIADVM